MAVIGDITFLNSVACAILSPSAQTVMLPVNGWALRIETDSTAFICDSTKVEVDVEDPGFNPDGTASVVARTLKGVKQLRRTYNEATSFNPGGAGIFDIVLTDEIFIGSTVVRVRLIAGFLPGQAASTHTTVIRLDNSPYPKVIARLTTPNYSRISNNSFVSGVNIIHRFARNNSLVARVEQGITVGATVGTAAAATLMVRSRWTPAGDTHPGGIPAQEYEVTINAAGVPDGVGELWTRVYPWIGPVYDTRTSPNTEVWPTLNTAKGVPIVRDFAGVYSPIYVFVNQNGTAGASPAVQTTLTDPGSVGSYASMLDAINAGIAWNNSSINRGVGNTHADTAGVVVVLRDVAGSTEGDSATSYRIGNDLVAVAVGPVPLVIRSFSGVFGDAVRLRAYTTANVELTTTQRKVPKRVDWYGIKFDGIGSTLTGNIIINGDVTTAPFPAASALVSHNFFDCQSRESLTAGVANSWFWRPGFTYFWRSHLSNVLAAASINSLNTTYGNGVNYIASWLERPTSTAVNCTPGLMSGVRLTNVAIRQPIVSGQPDFDTHIFYNVRQDAQAPLSSGFDHANNRPIYNGLGICNYLYRKTGISVAALLRIGGDGSKRIYTDVVLQHVGLFGERANLNYHDRGKVTLPKKLTMLGCSFHSYNNKRDTFNAPETWANDSEGLHSTANKYYFGAIVHNAGEAVISSVTRVGTTATVTTATAHGFSSGLFIRMLGTLVGTATTYQGRFSITVLNSTQFTYTMGATPAGDATTMGYIVGPNTTYYSSLQDVPTGIALSNTAYWMNNGSGLHETIFGPDPARVGNWFSAFGVGSYGNFASTNASGIPGSGPVSWYGDRFPGVVDIPYAGWVIRDTSANGTNDWADQGDYKPGPGSPLLDQVGAGLACTLFDLAGIIRRNGGNGAAGPYEVLSQDVGPFPGLNQSALFSPTLTLTALSTKTITLPFLNSARLFPFEVTIGRVVGRLFPFQLTQGRQMGRLFPFELYQTEARNSIRPTFLESGNKRVIPFTLPAANPLLSSFRTPTPIRRPFRSRSVTSRRSFTTTCNIKQGRCEAKPRNCNPARLRGR